MTVKEFQEKQHEAERVRLDLQAGINAVSKAFEILQDKKNKVPKEAVDLARPELNQAITAANHAVSALRQYENLLDDIARKTRLEWPPACGQEQ